MLAFCGKLLEEGNPVIVSSKNFDFDAFAMLAHSDPDAFEALRRETIDAAINNAPVEQQEKLRCLQWRIDQIRKVSGTPLAACLRFYSMMWDTVLGNGGLLEHLNAFVQGRNPPLPNRGKSAKILGFPKRTREDVSEGQSYPPVEVIVSNHEKN